MEQPNNLKEYKIELRQKFKERRRLMTKSRKEVADKRIASRLASLASYKRAKTVLTYVSTEIEVDTKEIIKQAIADYKSNFSTISK